MKILVLDDDLRRHESFKFHLFKYDVKHVYTANQARAALRDEGPWDVVFLDHDLMEAHYSSADTGNVAVLEETGYEVALYIAEWLEAHQLPKMVVVHSWNPAGTARMIAALSAKSGYKTRRWQFNPTENPIVLLGLSEV